MNKEKRIAILTRLRDENPHPTTELNFNSPFELLIAVLLSAQATDVSVNKATALLYPVANTPKAMLELGVDGVKSYIKTIGLFNSKAENVIKTCRILLEQHGVKCRKIAPRWKHYPAWDARLRMWYLTPRLAGRLSPLIPIFSASLTARTSHRARMSSRLKRNC